MNELLGLQRQKILKKSAIPTVFPNRGIQKSVLKRHFTVQRLSKKDRADLISEKILTDNEPYLLDPNDLFQGEPDTIGGTRDLIKTITETLDYEKSQKELSSLKLKFETQDRKIQKMQELISRQRLEIARLKSVNNGLRLKFNSEKHANIKVSPAQAKLLKGSKRVNWHVSDIIRALTVRSINPKAYETAISTWNLPLPSVRTLQRWSSKFRCDEGILSDVLLVLAEKAKSMDNFSRLCVLSFDEMSVDSTVVSDPTSDKLYSNSKVQVIMIRGICSSWKQPIFYKFDTNVTKLLLESLISAIELAGFIVVAIVSDLGAENRALQREIHVTPNNLSFANPHDNKRPVFFFADIPHCLKNIRNHLLDDGVMLSNGTIINKATMYKLLENNGTELMLVPHLTPQALEISGAERMRVRPAAKLLSHRTATLAKRVFPNNPEISDFFQIFNDGFDVLNSRVRLHNANNMKSAYGVFLEEQESILLRLESVVQSIRFLTPKGNKKKALLPCQDGFLLSIRSARELLKFLKAQYLVSYILTSRLNQDCLENLFSKIRSFSGSNPHPSPPDFKFRLRLLILGSRARTPRGANTEADQDDESYISTELLRNRPFPQRRSSNEDKENDQCVKVVSK